MNNHDKPHHGLKSKTIKSVIRNKINAWLDSIKDEPLRDACRKEAIVTGGCIASMLLGEDVNDFDVYFRTKETVLGVAKYYVKEFTDGRAAQGGVPVDIYPEEVTDSDGKARIRIVVKSAGVAGEDQKQDYQYFEKFAALHSQSKSARHPLPVWPVRRGDEDARSMASHHASHPPQSVTRCESAALRGAVIFWTCDQPTRSATALKWAIHKAVSSVRRERFTSLSFLMGMGVGVGASVWHPLGICGGIASACPASFVFNGLAVHLAFAASRFFSLLPLTKSRSFVSLFCVHAPFPMVQNAAMTGRIARHFLSERPVMIASRLSSSGKQQSGDRHANISRRR